MDFQNMKRRQLQALCKLNNIPANLTNASMAHSLSLLPSVQGLEEFMRDPTAADPGSPDGSVITSPDVFRTSTRQKVTKEETEGSRMATRTCCGTRTRAVEGTDARKTTATRTTRKRASQEAMVQKQTENDLQANFEADMEQSQVSDNSGLLGELDNVSGVNMDYDEQVSLESQNGSKNEVYEVVNDVQDVSDVDDNKKNLQNNDAVKEADQEEPREMLNSVQKVDFHNFSRRDLQSLCKKNKIPANTTNATMADALESLEIVEGLEEVLLQCNSQAPHSPTMSEMTSSYARRGWTSRRVNKEPTRSNLMTKSCRGSNRNVIEEMALEKTALIETPEAGTIVCSVESVLQSEVQSSCELGSIKSAEEQSEDIEYAGEIKSGKARLSVAEGELDLQCQIEAADLDYPEVPHLVSDTGNDNGNYGLLNSENIEQQEVSEDKIEADIADHIGSEVPEQLQNMDNQTNENTHEVSSGVGSKNTEVADYNVESGSDSEVKQLESGDDGMSSENEVSSSAREHDSENSKIENLAKGSDSGVFSDAGSECELDDLSLVGKLERMLEDQLSEKLIKSYQPPILVNNAETGLAMTTTDSTVQLCAAERIESKAAEENVSQNDTALIFHPMGMLEASCTEHEMAKKPNSESTILTDECGAEEKMTPLDKKSLRTLKKMLKEKLKETSLLANKMENLTLEENDDSLAKVEEVMEEECKNFEFKSDEVTSPVISGVAAELVPSEDLKDLTESIDVNADNHMGGIVEDSEVTFDVDAADLYSVDNLLNDAISEDSVTGHIPTEVNREMISGNHMSITPSKLMKTPMSVGRMNNDSDVNKENIDHSASRTKSANIVDSMSGKVASAMSMGKLKKALLHSEKKRSALHDRLDNCNALASP
ncbi:hypothetical protein RND81_14G138200 [Saponaria officinalis]|uniref:Uncharacterized protein n=1 Tax=Saponaria officinalis TaxID=3572 RepID=A0AAW1GW27_SAPOF